MAKLPGWLFEAILFEPLARVAPGIAAAVQQEGFKAITLEDNEDLETQLPCNATLLVVGAVFEAFGVELCAWAKRQRIPVTAIQEVAQLALNQCDINNYDAPFDRLFVASPDEYKRFIALGYPRRMLRISGLLSYERLRVNNRKEQEAMLAKLGIADGKNPIVYTTSPIRGRLKLHNKDNLAFREAILTQIASASRQTGRRAIIKLHPNEEIESTRDQILKIIPDAIVTGREFHIDELFGVAGVLVNRGNSQTCLEGVLRGIPTVVAACGLATLFHTDGGAYIVNDLRRVSDTIVRACAEGPVDISNVQARHFFLPTGGVAGFLAHELADLAADPPLADHANWNWLIKSMLFIGRHDRALQFCETLAARSAWQEQVFIALKAHAENRLQGVITGWLDCSAIDPNWFFPHYELAHAYQSSGEFQRAIENAHEAIRLHPPYHALWHEIPMRVVIMASLRKMGDLNGAAVEMKLMDERELVEFVPELLIEKAAQAIAQNGQLQGSYDDLVNALRQLNAYPINEAIDDQIRERALARLHELGQSCEKQKNYPVAEYCYALILETRPDDAWAKLKSARVTLVQGRLLAAAKILHDITKVPDATKKAMDEVLPSRIAAALKPYWPASPRSIVGPLKLAIFTLCWAMARILRSGFRNVSNPATASLLVVIFVLRHLFRRLRAESVGLRGTLRTLRNHLPGSSAYRSYEVKNCPICGDQGKFEYENKLTPLFRCLGCDHVYARQLPDDQVLGTLYSDMSYWEKDRLHQGITSLQEGTEWETYLNARMGILQRLHLLNPPANHVKSVFEIGCAEGMLLRALKKRGMTVAGCEMNRAVASQGIKYFGVKIYTEPFENLSLPERQYDLVISFHTLEHMRFPVKVLAKIAQILRPDGSVLIEVPCGEEEYENTDHLHFFSETSVRLLLNEFFLSTEIIGNTYTNSGGVKIGSFYGIGHGVRNQLDDRLER